MQGAVHRMAVALERASLALQERQASFSTPRSSPRDATHSSASSPAVGPAQSPSPGSIGDCSVLLASMCWHVDDIDWTRWEKTSLGSQSSAGSLMAGLWKTYHSSQGNRSAFMSSMSHAKDLCMSKEVEHFDVLHCNMAAHQQLSCKPPVVSLIIFLFGEQHPSEVHVCHDKSMRVQVMCGSCCCR